MPKGYNTPSGYTYQGQPIYLAKTRGARPQGLRKLAMEKGMYDEEKRIEAVTVYVVTGSMDQMESITGVSKAIFKKWKKEPWFQIVVNDVRLERNEDTDAKFSELLELVLGQIKDRVVNGEKYVTQGGKVIQKPVSARDLALIASINVDKRKIVRDEAKGAVQAEQKKDGAEVIVNKLDELKKVFEDLATKGTKAGVVKLEKVG
jgi:hypothetical protein